MELSFDTVLVCSQLKYVILQYNMLLEPVKMFAGSGPENVETWFRTGQYGIHYTEMPG